MTGHPDCDCAIVRCDDCAIVRYRCRVTLSVLAKSYCLLSCVGWPSTCVGWPSAVMCRLAECCRVTLSVLAKSFVMCRLAEYHDMVIGKYTISRGKHHLKCTTYGRDSANDP